jgi:hypothetical protein
MDKIKKYTHGGLGRWPFLQPQDAMYLMRHELKRSDIVVPEDKVWQHGDILNQGNEGACVGFGWTAWENAKPRGFRVQQGYDYAFDWYKKAQGIDPWPGDDYSGTTVRAGARIGVQRELLGTYLWGSGKDDIDAWLLTKGPIVVGSTWFRSMDSVGPLGWVKVDPSSGKRGGHCYLLLGRRSGNYVFQNSWGAGYADDGLFYMNTENFIKLLSWGDAEFCTAAQVKAA